MKPFYLALAALLLALSIAPRPVQAADTYKVNLFLVSPPGESWTPEEQTRVVQATTDATAWWSRNSRVEVPNFELGWTAVITPTDFSYSILVWELNYLPHIDDDPATWPKNLTVFVIDNSSSHRTLGGALGYGQHPLRAVTALSSGVGSSVEGLATVIAHEYGHAVLNLDFDPDPAPWKFKEHAPVGSFDIMAPNAAQEVYTSNTLGYYTRVAMGERFQHKYLALVAR